MGEAAPPGAEKMSHLSQQLPTRAVEENQTEDQEGGSSDGGAETITVLCLLSHSVARGLL